MEQELKKTKQREQGHQEKLAEIQQEVEQVKQREQELRRKLDVAEGNKIMREREAKYKSTGPGVQNTGIEKQGCAGKQRFKNSA